MRHKAALVAYIDVLGFARRTTSDDFMTTVTAYRTALAESVGHSSDVQVTAFSDSIFIYCKKRPPVDLEPFLTVVSLVMGKMLKAGFPVRGAVACGQYSVAGRAGNLLVAGPALVEAVRREGAQDWVGVSLCGSVLSYHRGPLDRPEFLKRRQTFSAFEIADTEERLGLDAVVRRGAVPLKMGAGFASQDIPGFAIAPTLAPDVGLAQWVADTKSIIRDLKWMGLQAERTEDQLKYERTCQWLGSLLPLEGETGGF